MRHFLAENKGLTLLSLTLFLGVLPFVPYEWARLFGGLPSEAVWNNRGGNHGPWWDSRQHFWVIFLPIVSLVILPAPTLFTAIVDSVVNKRSLLSTQGSGLFLLLLCPLQWVLAMTQFLTVFWTLD